MPFGLESVQDLVLEPAKLFLNPRDIKRHQEAPWPTSVSGTSLNRCWPPTAKLQQLRLYYTFPVVAVDARTPLGDEIAHGGSQQVLIAAREIDRPRLRKAHGNLVETAIWSSPWLWLSTVSPVNHVSAPTACPSFFCQRIWAGSGRVAGK